MAQTLQDLQLTHFTDAYAAGTITREIFEQEFSKAENRMTTALRTVASDPRFREAVAWQNPRLIPQCLDKTVAGERRNVRGRNHQATIAGYIQRYSLKNDTIGFFGPVGWGEWVDTPGGLCKSASDPQQHRSRTLYHEYWAIDTVAKALTASPECRPHAVPRQAPEVSRQGRIIRDARQRIIVLTPDQQLLLDAADGERTISDIAAGLAWDSPRLSDPETCWRLLDDMAEAGVVAFDWAGPVEAHPEARLRSRLRMIPDQDLRDALVAQLDRYLELAEDVASAHGTDGPLVTALDRLGEEFTQLTGHAATRREGQTYAGRTLVYEDVRSDVHIDAGTDLREQIGSVLAAVLDSANWLTDRIASEYTHVYEAIFDRKTQQLATASIPLTALLSAATSHMFISLRRLPGPVLRAQQEFQHRWATVHQAIDGGPDVHLSLAEASQRLTAAFSDRANSAPWPMAYTHTPDLMLAQTGDSSTGVMGILGEVHVSVNTLESRVFVEQSDAADWMLRASENSVVAPRYYSVLSKQNLGVTSRLSPPSALLSPQYRYWTRHAPCVEVPGPCLPASGLQVRRDDGRLVVIDANGEPFGTLLDVIGENLSAAAANAFSLMPSWHRRPRVRVGDLVLSRRSWRFEASELRWAGQPDERLRFAAARAWRLEQGVPELVFYKTPVDDKPMFADGSSIVLINELAKAIRQSVDEVGYVTMTEMMPDFDQQWLHDREGRPYTFELRMVCSPGVGEG